MHVVLLRLLAVGETVQPGAVREEGVDIEERVIIAVL